LDFLVGDGGTLCEGVLYLLKVFYSGCVLRFGYVEAEVWDKCAFKVGGGAEEAPSAVGVGWAGLEARPGVSIKV
jgi:hypothetical protein